MQYNESELPGEIGWISSKPRWTGEDWAFLFAVGSAVLLVLIVFGVI